MDNIIGTNDIGTVLGAVPEEWAAYHQQEKAALDAAMAQQVLGMMSGTIGAAPPQPHIPPKPPKTPPKGLSKLSTPAKKGGGLAKIYTDAKGNKQTAYERGLENVKGAAAFAQKKGTETVARGAAYHPSEHKPLAVTTGHGVHGVFGAILGFVDDPYVGAAPAALTQKQHTAVTAHNNAIARTHAAATNAVKAGNQAVAAGKKAAAHAKQVQPIFDKLHGKPPHGVHGILGYYLGYGYPLVGADPDPNNPGYLTDGSPDPSYWSQSGAGGGDMGAYANLYDPTYWGFPAIQPLFTDLSGDNPDPNLTPVPDADLYTDLGGANPDPNLTPPVGGGALSKDDAKVVWDTVPANAVTYDTTARGAPGATFQSWNMVYGGGDGFFLDNTWKVRRGGRDEEASDAEKQDIPSYSIRYGWGPIIAIPGSPLAGLQWAMKDRKWFWQIQNAPKDQVAQQNAAIVDANAAILKADNAAIMQAHQALVDTNATILATDNAAVTASNANITQQVATLAEAKIKQDAANALALSQAQTQAAASATTSQEQQAEAQAKLDQAAQQEQLDEQSRASQLEADMTRAQQQADAQQAQYESQLALAQTQAMVQLAPIQAQADAQAQQAQLQMMQMMLQSPYGFDSAQGIDSSQMGGFDPSQMIDPMQMVDPSQMIDPSQMSGFDPTQAGYDPTQGGIDPTQIPGFFDASMYYGG